MHKLFSYRLPVFALAGALFLATPMTAAAAEPITPATFDYEEYADRFPDLKQNLGYDKDLLWFYYQTYGEQTDRQPAVTPAAYLNLNNFNWVAYAAANPDVAACFGNDPALLLNHYLTTGYKEGRLASGLDELTDSKCKAYVITHQITNAQMSDREKIKAVHDWIINHTTYDYDNYLKGTVPHVSHTMSGVMQKGTAVCDGYSKTFQFCMDILGIPCKIQTGSNHAWNLVKVDGSWYKVDCTWDDPIYMYNGVRMETLRYTYFMLPQ